MAKKKKETDNVTKVDLSKNKKQKDDNVIKVDLTKKTETDAVPEQSTDEIPVRDESEVSEEVLEENVEETNEKPQVDETKFESAGNDDVIKVDLNKPIKPVENEVKEDNTNDEGVAPKSEDAETPKEQEYKQLNKVSL